MITAITATRDRHEAFRLCARWMASQTVRDEIQWVVVDDGDQAVAPPPGCHYVRRGRSLNPNTLPENLLEALPQVHGEEVLIFEDDDYYPPSYCQEMRDRLKTSSAAGEVLARYYNVKARRWNISGVPEFASLCRTAFRRECLPIFTKAVLDTRNAGDVSVDRRFWEAVRQSQMAMSLFQEPKLCVSIKGLPGRAGLGRNHGDKSFPNFDASGKILEEWIGSEAAAAYWRIYPNPEIGRDVGITLRKFGFDIVHGCQLRCVGCPNSTLKPPIKFISKSDYVLCLQNVDVERIELFRLFNFGEPTYHPDLAFCVEEAHKQKWKTNCVEISTNGQYHHWERMEAVFRTQGLTRLVVSCDGNGTPSEYERLRPPSKWDKFIEFLQRCLELRDRFSPRTRLMTRTVCENPVDQERWKCLLVPMGWKPEFRGWLLLPESIENPSQLEGKKNGICSFMQSPVLYADYDGTVVPCCMHPKAFELGNLKRHKYTEILKGKVRGNRLQDLATKRETMAICRGCAL